MSRPLQELVAWLDSLEARAPLDLLKDRLNRCEVEPEELAEFVRFNPRTYARNPLRGGAWYQAWVMCWRNGQRSPIHDHKGSSCGVRVLHGVATESIFAFAPNGLVKPCFSRDLPTGGVTGSEDDDLHQISNLQAQGDLITLHVYSPPLRAMGTYSLTTPERGLDLLELEFCDAAGI